MTAGWREKGEEVVPPLFESYAPAYHTCRLYELTGNMPVVLIRENDVS